MVNQTTRVVVTNGDQLSEGYFNEVGSFYAEATDSSGSPLTHATATATLKRTFEFTGLASNYHLTRLEFDNITITDSSSNSNDSSQFMVIIHDGTNYYSFNKAQLNGFNSTADQVATIGAWQTATSSAPGGAVLRINSSTTIESLSIPIPYGLMTGATTWTVEIWLSATQTSANTVTLTNGFTTRLLFDKRPIDLGVTINQS